MCRYVVIVILIISCFISCKTINVPQIQEGIFNKNHIYYFVGSQIISENELILNKDSTFLLSLDGAIIINKCQGKWYYLDNKTIHLKCDDEKKYYLTLITDTTITPQDTSAIISFDPAWINGYMRVRERNVKIVNENKIRLEMYEPGGKKYIVLKRVKGGT